jgi:hypothetical protein
MKEVSAMALLGTRNKPDPEIFASLQSRAYAFLEKHPAGVLSTVDPNGDPHAAVIYYAVDSSLVVTFLTKRKTKKSDNLAHNSHAMLVVFDEALQTTAQVTGVVVEIVNSVEVQQVFRDTLRTSLHSGRSAIPPIVKLHAGEFVAYRLKPVKVRLSAYAHPDIRGPGKMFETLDLPL